jgi:hypothetical protein
MAVAACVAAHWVWRRGRGAWTWLIPLALAAGLGATAAHWQVACPQGRLCLKTLRGLPETGVQQWLNTLGPGLRVYSYGLQPYGLHGPDWSNRVRYQHTPCEPFSPQEARARVMDAVREFAPDVVILSNNRLDCGRSRFELPPAAVGRALEQAGYRPAYRDRGAVAYVR